MGRGVRAPMTTWCWRWRVRCGAVSGRGPGSRRLGSRAMRAHDPGPPHYLISVDLGIPPARTAMAVMEIHGVRPTVELHVRAISRPPLGTKTAAIIDETREVSDRLGEQFVRQYARWADPD